MKKTILALSLCMGLPLPSFADMAQQITLAQAGSCADQLKILTGLAGGGHGAAQVALAELYDGHRRCPSMKDAAKSQQWYLRAAEGGDVAAQKHVADMYMYGLGAPEDLALGVKWLGKAASQGDAGAQASLGTAYEDAKGVPRDRVLAHLLKSLYAAARTAKGDHEYDSHLARYAEQLSPDQLAESKQLAAQWKPGTALPTTSATGRKLPSQWYRNAAAAGDVNAAYRLGLIYKKGYEDGQDEGQAVEWLRRAAEKGHADAQQALSEMYTFGRAVPEDYVLAYMLSNLAANGGNDSAKTEWQDHWALTLTPAQLAEGKALAAHWTSGTPLPLGSQHGLERKVQRSKAVKAKLEATPEVVALFSAANEGDEPGFTRLLGAVGNINDYAVLHHTLLHALLMPPKSLRDTVLDWKRSNNGAAPPALAQSWRAAHLDVLPAKTRMLDVALRRGAGVHEGEPALHGAPLHLASIFGSPEMVRLLLRAGANPRQHGGDRYDYAPLEYSLALKEHGLDLPPMLTAPQRSDIILQLLAAGAERPFKSEDDADAIKNKRQNERPVADYRLWDQLATLTSGAEVLAAVAATGTAPYFSAKEPSVLARAAQAGNVGAVTWFKQRMPRSEKGGPDSWTDAAIWAMYAKPEAADAMLRELLVKDMAWTQIGPLSAGLRGGVKLAEWGPGPSGPATLLGHAALAGRAEWVRQLVKWGAPVGARESGQTALSQAVLTGDAKMVELLLGLGANPVEGGAESTLLLAVRSKSTGNDVLRLLLNDVAQKKRIALDDIEPSPLSYAFPGDGKAPDSERIKVLVGAGFSANRLGYEDLAAAMASSDRTLFGYLLDHGALKPAAGTDHSAMLVAAMRAKRADLLPRLLQLGLDPNARPEKGLTPLEHAIYSGNGAAFELFLQHGGRIDLAAGGPWGSVLDLAVRSDNADILRAVSSEHTVPLNGVCLPDGAMLQNTVLHASVAYWATLRQHGFGSAPALCPAMVERLMRALAASPDLMQVGWVGRRLGARLKDLGGGPGAAVSDATAARLHATGRDDLLQALHAGGWKVAAATAAAGKPALAPTKGKADLALQGRLVGHYYLESMREVGSEIVLTKDGRFSYALAYGSDDQFATGTWRVLNKQVVFRSQADALPAPYTLSAPVAADKPRDDAEVSVLVQYKDRKIPGMFVTLVGEQPALAHGVTEEAAWSAPLAGPLKHVVLYHPELNGGRAYVHNVADGTRSFTFEATAPQPRMEDFNLAMAVRDGQLIWARDGRDLVYKKADKAK